MGNHVISRILWRIITMLYYRLGFGKIGSHTTIYKPLQLDNVSSIYVGDKVCLASGAWLYGNKNKDKTLEIMDGTNIGHFSHIVALNSVKIEKKVLIADKVYISDSTHRYDDAAIPILEQRMKNVGEVVIGEGSWLGENVCVCGASIGKHCVVGANSVVISDIPDFCVAVGSPARVVKSYDLVSCEWKKGESK